MVVVYEAQVAPDMRETDAPVSISIVTQVPWILIVYLYGLTICLSVVAVLHLYKLNAYVSSHRLTSSASCVVFATR